MPRLLGSKLTTRKDLQRNMKRMGCVPSMGRPVMLKGNRCCCPPADWCKIEGSRESKLVPAGTCDPPVLTFVSLEDTTVTDNAGFTIAGSIVVLTFKSSNVINTPTVVFTIGGNAVATAPAVANTTGNTWTATYTVAANDAGKVSYTVDAKDKKGNEAETLTGTSDFVVDTGVPTVSFEYSLVSAPSTYLASAGVTPATRTDATKRVKKDDQIFITATADSVLLNLHASQDKLKFTLPASLGGGQTQFFPLPGTTKVYRSAALTVPGTLGTAVGYSGDMTVSTTHNASDEAGNNLVNASLSGQVYVDNVGVSLGAGTSFSTTGTATALAAGDVITVTVTSLENFTITTAAAALVTFNGQASTNAATPVGAGLAVAAKSHKFTLAVAGADATAGSKGAVALQIQTTSAFNTATVNNTQAEVATASGDAWNLAT